MNEESIYCPFCKSENIVWCETWVDARNEADQNNLIDLEEYQCHEEKCGKSFWI